MVHRHSSVDRGRKKQQRARGLKAKHKRSFDRKSRGSYCPLPIRITRPSHEYFMLRGGENAAFDGLRQGHKTGQVHIVAYMDLSPFPWLSAIVPHLSRDMGYSCLAAPFFATAISLSE